MPKKLKMQKKNLREIAKHEGYAGLKSARLSEWNTDLIETDEKGDIKSNPKNMKWGESKYGAYFDSKGFLTTGRGHLITRAKMGTDKFWEDINKHERQQKVVDILNTTREEADKIFIKDVVKHQNILNELVDRRDLSKNLVNALVTETYRGSVQKSPKTIKLINQGKFREAAKEYLDNKEYKTTKSKGIKDRMKAVAEALLEQAEQKEKEKTLKKLVN